MIAKLELDVVGPVPTFVLVQRLNEVIEAVNDLMSTHCPCVAAGRNLETCPVHGGTVNSPGFRPLHIEDGQVQEDTPAFRVFEDGVRWTNAPPVPEAEPQEQDDALGNAIDLFEEAVTARANASAFDFPASHRKVSTARDRLWAAHREYAQPGKGNG